MVIEKGLWPFKTAQIILDEKAAHAYMHKSGYGRIVILTHAKLDPHGFSLRQKETAIIDLDSLDEVRARFNKTARNEISRTERDPDFRFEVISGSMPDDAYQLYASSVEVREGKPHAQSTFDGMVFVLGYYRDELLSGLAIFPTRPVARIRSIFSRRFSVDDKDLYAKIGYASRRCMQEACKWGIENGRKGIDVGSVNRTDEQKSGMMMFKLSFGGRIVPEYTYTRTSALFSFFERLLR
ncbi:hypothetical protein HY968_00820 [Candidatus Kaiserbacteria bacterium]|nr:hypothetical protein [Candidatus Kaiserbacteria bacterium]